MHRCSLPLAGIVPLFLAIAATAQTLPESIGEAIQSELERSGAPSLQVAIGRGRKLIFEGAFGLADVENNVPATTETKYRSSSISKWLTATGAMLLAEQGRLNIDASVQEYCPQFPEKRWPITTRQLLTHTSGIRHYADYESELSQATTDQERASIERRQSRDALGTFTRYTDVIAPLDNFKDYPLVFEPGTSWLYSSFGYRLLGCVLEGASGREYRSFLMDEILAPAGMKHTVPDDAWAIVPHRAAGYRLDRGEPLRRADMRDVSENLPAGGHLTTATDLITFAQAFGAQELISAESFAQMTQGLSNNSEEPEDYTSWRHAIPSRDRYAYGIMSFPNESSLWIGHTGRQAGSSSIIVLVPDEDLSIAVLTNVKGWGGYLRLVRELHSIIQRQIGPAN
jgi:CubicO group peptidase (beta-lactamase class C family)